MNVPAPKQDIVAHEAAQTPAPAPSEAAAILNMIERAARDPSVDLDKMERLMKMRRDTLEEQARLAFSGAMRAAQAEMRPIAADAENAQTRSRYASYAQLDRALRPIYTKHGFSLSYDEADSPKPEHIRVLCYVDHDGGHTRTYRKDMPADGKGAKGGDVMTKTHAAGAAASYGARYLLKGIFNVAVGEDDRDGNASGDTITREQELHLGDLISRTHTSVARFVAIFKVDSLPDIPAARYQEALRILRERESQKGGAK